MRKLRIGVDLDGVCYHWDRTARYLLRERFYMGAHPEALNHPATEWDYIRNNVSQDAWRWLWSEGVRHGLFRHGHVMKGAVEGLRDLADMGHKLIVITHRPEVAVNDTLAWLSYMQFPLAGVHILTNEEPKSEVPCDVYIDDKPANIEDFWHNSQARLVALFDTPANQGYDDLAAPCVRVKSWKEFVQLIREGV